MKKLDRFLIRDTLSDGPAGTVYKAEEVLPGDNRRIVALKVLPALPSGESEAERRFFGEVRVLAQLAVHPHVVTIYSMGLTDGMPWLAMEYSPATLAQRLGEKPADPSEVTRVLKQVGSGLAALHALKPPLIHQDIKPANILVDQSENLKITDFSLATVTAANKTHNLATVRYAAPELLSNEFGRVGPATDLYALGHIAYEMALGDSAYRKQFPAVFEGNSSKDPSPNKWMMWHVSMGIKPEKLAVVIKGFPPHLSKIVARLMAKPLNERYSAADELVSDLQQPGQEVAEKVPASSDAPLDFAPERPGPIEPIQSESRDSAAPPPRPARTFSPPPARQVPAPAVPASQPSLSASRASGHYWVRLRGKVSGPFNLATLQAQVKQGQISRLHQVSVDQTNWKQASDVEGLYGPTIV